MIPNWHKRRDAEKIKKRIPLGLRERGYNLTPQRLEIIDVLSRDRSHPRVYDLFSRVKKRIPKISLSTVYYTLSLLKTEGLIKEIEYYDKENRYESNITNHLDLVCLRCGAIRDFKEGFPVSLKTVEHDTGFRAHDMRFEYYGYCKKCKRSKG